VTTAAVVGWQALPFGQPALPAGEQHPQLPGRQVVDGEVETPAEDSAADAAEKPQGSGASANGNGLRPASTATSGQAPRVEIPRTPWPVE
jgi:hypothetical protein